MNWHTELLPDPLPREPLSIAARWLREARETGAQPNPDAMVLATADAQGNPSARVVLCKAITADPGYLVFYTNYASRKGLELAQRPRAAVVMHWDALHRQLRIEGPVVKLPAADSDAYFAGRPWQRRVGAWASQQSQPVDSRDALLRAVEQTAARFGTPSWNTESEESGPDSPVPRPPHWGGYCLWAEAVELWAEGESRIHDRARWTRTLTPVSASTNEPAFSAGPWSATRLQP